MHSTANPYPNAVEKLAEHCFGLACAEATEIMGGPEHITLDDLTGCEMVALLTIIRPAFQRRAASQRQPAPVFTLVPR